MTDIKAMKGLFQDTEGKVPVTTLGQPVGLVRPKLIPLAQSQIDSINNLNCKPLFSSKGVIMKSNPKAFTDKELNFMLDMLGKTSTSLQAELKRLSFDQQVLWNSSDKDTETGCKAFDILNKVRDRRRLLKQEHNVIADFIHKLKTHR